MTPDRTHSNTVGRVVNKVRVGWNGLRPLQPFYVPKYRSSDALSAPEFFFFISWVSVICSLFLLCTRCDQKVPAPPPPLLQNKNNTFKKKLGPRITVVLGVVPLRCNALSHLVFHCWKMFLNILVSVTAWSATCDSFWIS